MKEQRNIDEVFKEAFDRFEVDPGSDAWASIQAGIDSGGAAASSASSAASSATTASVSWITTAIVGLAISAAAIGGYYLFNQHGEAKLNKAITQKNNQRAENKVDKKNQQPTSESIEAAALENEKLKESKEKVELENRKVFQANETTENHNKDKKVISNKNDLKLTSIDTISNGSYKSNNANISAKEGADNLTEGANTEETSSFQKAADKGEIPSENVQNISTSKDKTNGSEENEFYTPLEEEDNIVDVHVEFPNTFTPNQDGTNDIFEITNGLSKGLSHIQEARMIIQDHTGKTVAIWSGINGGWDGTLSNGSNAPSGKYFYQFFYSVNNTPQQPLKGLLTLSR